MTNISAAAEANREHARTANGQFGNQHHTAPAPFTSDTDTATGAGRFAGYQYTPPMTVSGYVPDEFAQELAVALQWARDRGNQSADVQLVRQYAGPMSDAAFTRLAEHYNTSLDDNQFEPDGFEAWARDAEAAYLDGSGPAPEFTTAESTASDGYLGATKVVGGKYAETQHLPETVVAKHIRNDIRQATKQGWLPSEVNVSVRTRRGTSGFDIDVRVSQEIFDGTRTPWNDRPDWPGTKLEHARHTGVLGETHRRIQQIADQYAYFDSNSQVDYFGDYRTSRVSTMNPEYDR